MAKEKELSGKKGLTEKDEIQKEGDLPAREEKGQVSRWKKIASGLLIGGVTAGFIVGFVFGTAFGFGMNLAKNRNASGGKAEKEDGNKAERFSEVSKLVTLGKYKNRKISLIPTEEDIENARKSELENYTNYEQLKGTAKSGDMVYADFEGSIGGEKMEELCGSDFIEIGSNEWLKDFEEAFVGMKTGKTKKVSVKIPEGTYGNENIDGRTVKFKLKLRYICGEAIEPDYNDEFVQSISNYKTVEEYDAHLREEEIKTAEEEKAEYAWSELLKDSLIASYPEELLEAAREEVLQDYYDMAEIQGCTRDEMFQSFGFADEKEFVDNQLEELAQDTVKEIMVAEAVSDKEGVYYTQKEYKTLCREEYENNKSSYESEEEFEKENRNHLKNTALIEKVKSWIDKHTDYVREEQK